MTFTLAEHKRYSRHLALPQVGISGQQKLKQAKVLIIGLGGLGSPVAMYLASAGIGQLGLVEYDVVDLSNLQRQILHGTQAVGQAKLDSAVTRLQDINPFVQLQTYNTPLTSDNALDILADYDVIIDGTDNFPTRYLTNDACALLGKPLVYGSIFRFDGQVSIFNTPQGPCYRCLFPTPPPPDAVPNCAEGGVLGVLPGVIGSIQATEAIKLIAGIGQPLIGRLLMYDALAMRFDEIKLRKNPHCPVCSDKPTITELIDYEAFCGMPAHDHTAPTDNTIPQITPQALQQRLAHGKPLQLVDVRQPYEWDIVNLSHQGAILLPQADIMNHLDQLKQAQDVIIYCRSGVRSTQVVHQLQAQGFTHVINLDGGILRWAKDVEPHLPTY